VLGFDAATGGDEMFRDLALARIIEPTSKVDSLRVLSETGVEPVDYRTVTRHLPMFAKPTVRQALSKACASHAGLGPANLVLYDVSTLYFEPMPVMGFREPGFSKERHPGRNTPKAKMRANPEGPETTNRAYPGSLAFFRPAVRVRPFRWS
jgi:hypothetical protein